MRSYLAVGLLFVALIFGAYRTGQYLEWVRAKDACYMNLVRVALDYSEGDVMLDQTDRLAAVFCKF